MDPFATLGLPARFDLTQQEIESRWKEMQKALHPDRHADKPPAERRLALGKAVEVNEAYRALRDDLARATALLALRGHVMEERDGAKADPDFLMEIMELREELAAARNARDLAKARRLGERVAGDQADAMTRLTALFASEAEPTRIAASIARLRYYRRFLDELALVEEEALS